MGKPILDRVPFGAVLLAVLAMTAIAWHSQRVARCQEYEFTTLAGAFSRGSNDGMGTAARFGDPQGIAVDSAGNLYVADTDNNTIRKITPDRMVSTLAGLAGEEGSADGSGSAARFTSPQGIAVDCAGNVYVADTGNHTIRRITPSGFVSTLAGLAGSSGSANGVGSSARFGWPRGVAVSRSGTVYVADRVNCTIRQITPDGLVSTLAGVAGAWGSADGRGSTARFNAPHGVAVDNAGSIYVSDRGNNTVRKITADGEVSTLAGLAGSQGSADGPGTAARFFGPSGIGVDTTGKIYVADRANCTIRNITSEGLVTTFAGFAGISGGADGPGHAAQFNWPLALAVDSTGSVYVADTDNNTIRQISSDGVVSTIAGVADLASADGLAGAARFAEPSAVALDRAGNLYVADSSNDTIRKITPDGMVSTLAGRARDSGAADGLGVAAQFSGPYGIVLDAAGNICVADAHNSTIRKITPVGEVSTLAGLAGARGSADGIGGSARFQEPCGLAIDPTGTLYVTDAGSDTIRKITPDGSVTTLAGRAGNSGSQDGPGGDARFFQPRGVAADSSGFVYVSDSYNHTIRKIMPDGAVSTWAGKAGAIGSTDGDRGNARFYYPAGVAVDGFGNLFVADSGNGTIRKIGSDGTVTTFGGLPESEGSVDGIGSMARFSSPEGIAVDGLGNVYVADRYNNSIRKGAPRTAGPRIVSLSCVNSTTVRLTFHSTASGATAFAIESAGSLAGLIQWSVETIASITNTEPGSFEALLPAQNTRRFYRLRLTR